MRPAYLDAAAASGRRYLVIRLVFTHEVPPMFGPYLFAPRLA